ncbi:type II toxin-antitoxin system VapC family toxin [Microcoleus sp. PH2017_18_LLB_O_A]|uniref:type II toxin-antitoxin system VapC family toxin n=1 Tax=Microcoleus sp. PH2017_18_LLB_O_A TaxID=2798829 RepID=UPI001D25818E|nr:type II toxin-antitoxin system VapC family toxin [Microcoleus sp. PH2017_18_LLB_O_A]MCC3518820.1 type II toxin-antitoxin system VapC family toxin [Microcoleus sp. PH2017_18_LLB_O_A]
MSGNRYVLDTNAIVALLQGNLQLVELLKDADWLGVSIISQIEFLVFPGLTKDDRQIFEQFLQRVEVLGLGAMDAILIEKIIEIRQQHRLKLPDAVIAAMAIQNSATLVTADREFAKVTILTVINW